MPSYSQQRSTVSTTTVVASVAAATAATGAFLLVRRFGFEGAFWYVWEGDPYPPRVRYQFWSLDEQAKKLAGDVRLLDKLELCLEKARLDTIDGVSPVASWAQFVEEEFPKKKNRSLEKTLALLSYNLDKIAAEVDGIVSDGHVDIKLRKKALSENIVRAMERTDTLIKLYEKENGSQDASKSN